MWLSGQSVFTFLNAEVWPRLRDQDPANSFPYLDFGLQAFTVGILWLAVVIVFWTWRLGSRRGGARDAGEHFAGTDA